MQEISIIFLAKIVYIFSIFYKFSSFSQAQAPEEKLQHGVLLFNTTAEDISKNDIKQLNMDEKSSSESGIFTTNTLTSVYVNNIVNRSLPMRNASFSIEKEVESDTEYLENISSSSSTLNQSISIKNDEIVHVPSMAAALIIPDQQNSTTDSSNLTIDIEKELKTTLGDVLVTKSQQSLNEKHLSNNTSDVSQLLTFDNTATITENKPQLSCPSGFDLHIENSMSNPSHGEADNIFEKAVCRRVLPATANCPSYVFMNSTKETRHSDNHCETVLEQPPIAGCAEGFNLSIFPDKRCLKHRLLQKPVLTCNNGKLVNNVCEIESIINAKITPVCEKAGGLVGVCLTTGCPQAESLVANKPRRRLRAAATATVSPVSRGNSEALGAYDALYHDNGLAYPSKDSTHNSNTASFITLPPTEEERIVNEIISHFTSLEHQREAESAKLDGEMQKKLEGAIQSSFDGKKLVDPIIDVALPVNHRKSTKISKTKIPRKMKERNSLRRAPKSEKKTLEKRSKHKKRRLMDHSHRMSSHVYRDTMKKQVELISELLEQTPNFQNSRVTRNILRANQPQTLLQQLVAPITQPSNQFTVQKFDSTSQQATFNNSSINRPAQWIIIPDRVRRELTRIARHTSSVDHYHTRRKTNKVDITPIISSGNAVDTENPHPSSLTKPPSNCHYNSYLASEKELTTMYRPACPEGYKVITENPQKCRKIITEEPQLQCPTGSVLLQTIPFTSEANANQILPNITTLTSSLRRLEQPLLTSKAEEEEDFPLIYYTQQQGAGNINKSSRRTSLRPKLQLNKLPKNKLIQTAETVLEIKGDNEILAYLPTAALRSAPKRMVQKHILEWQQSSGCYTTDITPVKWSCPSNFTLTEMNNKQNNEFSLNNPFTCLKIEIYPSILTCSSGKLEEKFCVEVQTADISCPKGTIKVPNNSSNSNEGQFLCNLLESV